MVREAGGTVAEIDGGDFIKSGAIVASNANLMPQLTKALHP